MRAGLSAGGHAGGAHLLSYAEASAVDGDAEGDADLGRGAGDDGNGRS